MTAADKLSPSVEEAVREAARKVARICLGECDGVDDKLAARLLKALALRVVEIERERAAKVADDIGDAYADKAAQTLHAENSLAASDAAHVSAKIAAAIREA